MRTKKKKQPLHWLERREVVTPVSRITVDIWLDEDQLRVQAVKAHRSKTQRSRDGALVMEVVSWEGRKDE